MQQKAKQKKILILGALPRSLVNFRGPLIKALQQKDLIVHTAANGRNERTETTLTSWDVTYSPVKISRSGMNPFADMQTVWSLIKLIKRIKPDVVLNYTIKPVVFGGLAARFCGVNQVYSMVEGLGRAFMPWESFAHGVSSIIAKLLYRISLPLSKKVFFLNPDDLHHFVKSKYLAKNKAVLLNGIGVDLDHYAVRPIKSSTKIKFLMIARLLRDKGVFEYIEAAKAIKKKYKDVEFILTGDLDENPSSVSSQQLHGWQEAGVIHYLGYKPDVRELIEDCHIYVLPSYREGTPRTVLEAMSMGRPIITTDVPGCRETVINNKNGFLVQVKNVDALAEAMERFIKNPNLINTMGSRSRMIAEEKYDVHKVNEAILEHMELGK